MITTHVLDTALGRPAEGVHVALRAIHDRGEQTVATATTGADGRVRKLGPAELDTGRYCLVFDTEGYHRRTDQPAFFPEVMITFTVTDGAAHHHVPLLLSPYAYSTYRGS